MINDDEKVLKRGGIFDDSTEDSFQNTEIVESFSDEVNNIQKTTATKNTMIIFVSAFTVISTVIVRTHYNNEKEVPKDFNIVPLVYRALNAYNDSSGRLFSRELSHAIHSTNIPLDNRECSANILQRVVEVLGSKYESTARDIFLQHFDPLNSVNLSLIKNTQHDSIDDEDIDLLKNLNIPISKPEANLSSVSARKELSDTLFLKDLLYTLNTINDQEAQIKILNNFPQFSLSLYEANENIHILQNYFHTLSTKKEESKLQMFLQRIQNKQSVYDCQFPT